MPKTILIIDDDADFRSAVRIILESDGYACAEAASCQTGLKAASSHQPDLILLDVMMEDISSGFRLAKFLRDDCAEGSNHDIPIIMISNVQNIMNIQFKDRVGTGLLPVDGFINKPVDPDVLLKQVRKMVV